MKSDIVFLPYSQFFTFLSLLYISWTWKVLDFILPWEITSSCTLDVTCWKHIFIGGKDVWGVVGAMNRIDSWNCYFSSQSGKFFTFVREKSGNLKNLRLLQSWHGCLSHEHCLEVIKDADLHKIAGLRPYSVLSKCTWAFI